LVKVIVLYREGRFKTPGFEAAALYQGAFQKIQFFGKAALFFREKAGPGPLFREPFPKLIELWEWLSLKEKAGCDRFFGSLF
jgi:hypothetical protein